MHVIRFTSIDGVLLSGHPFCSGSDRYVLVPWGHLVNPAATLHSSYRIYRHDSGDFIGSIPGIGSLEQSMTLARNWIQTGTMRTPVRDSRNTINQYDREAWALARLQQ